MQFPSVVVMHASLQKAAMIMDPESSAEQVMEFVGGLLARLEGLQKKAFTYKSYQKNFKVSKRS